MLHNEQIHLTITHTIYNEVGEGKFKHTKHLKFVYSLHLLHTDI